MQLLVQQLFLGTIDYFSLELLVESKLVIVEVYSITDDSDYNFLFLLKQFESTRKNYIITKKIVIYMIKMYM